MIGQAERDILESVIEVTNQPVDKFRFKMDEVEGLRFVYLKKIYIKIVNSYIFENSLWIRNFCETL